jgi:hypothetical protein
MDHVARRINLDHRGCQMSGVQVALKHVLPVEEKHMVVGIHTDSAQPSEDPTVW